MVLLSVFFFESDVSPFATELSPEGVRGVLSLPVPVPVVALLPSPSPVLPLLPFVPLFVSVDGVVVDVSPLPPVSPVPPVSPPVSVPLGEGEAPLFSLLFYTSTST